MIRRNILPFIASAAIASSAMGAVVINEFAYDDTGTDTMEFVELYNSGPGAVDISGWTLIGIDLAGTPDSTAAIPASTTLAANDYYVIGMTAVPNVDLDVTASPDFQNDMEAIALRDGSTAVIDSVVYERNKGNIVIPAGLGEPAFNGSSATSGGGIFSNYILVESGAVDAAGLDTDGTPNASFSYGRHADGQDTNVNDLDFGVQIATPGTANNSHGTVNPASFPYVNNFDVTDGTVLPDFAGAYCSGTVQDPTVADTLPTGSAAVNPNAIVASPQGGNILVCGDGSGGGQAHIVNLSAPVQNVEFEAYVYLMGPLPTAGDTEEASPVILRGRVDPSPYNTGTGNGDVGIRWRYARSSTASELFLEERKAGASTQIGSTIQITTPGWYRLVLQVNGTNVLGIFGGTYGANDGTVITGTTTINQLGGVCMGWREALVAAGDTNMNMLRYDAVRVRPPTLSGVEDWSMY